MRAIQEKERKKKKLNTGSKHEAMRKCDCGAENTGVSTVNIWEP